MTHPEIISNFSLVLRDSGPPADLETDSQVFQTAKPSWLRLRILGLISAGKETHVTATVCDVVGEFESMKRQRFRHPVTTLRR